MVLVSFIRGWAFFFAYMLWLLLESILVSIYLRRKNPFDEDGHATSGSYQLELIMTKVAGYIMRAIHHWAATLWSLQFSFT